MNHLAAVSEESSGRCKYRALEETRERPAIIDTSRAKPMQAATTFLSLFLFLCFLTTARNVKNVSVCDDVRSLLGGQRRL